MSVRSVMMSLVAMSYILRYKLRESQFLAIRCCVSRRLPETRCRGSGESADQDALSQPRSGGPRWPYPRNGHLRCRTAMAAPDGTVLAMATRREPAMGEPVSARLAPVGQREAIVTAGRCVQRTVLRGIR